MGDDFDLFPKRESLDPFSFGTKSKKEEEKAKDGDREDLLFDEESIQAPSEPTSSPRPPSPGRADEGTARDKAVTVKEDADDVFGVDRVLGGRDEPSIKGPIPDDQSGYGLPPRGEETGKGSRKTPSPFVTIGGALLLILVILYGVLTYFQKAKRPSAPVPAGSVTMRVPKQAEKPVVDEPAQAVVVPEEARPDEAPPEAAGPEEAPQEAVPSPGEGQETEPPQVEVSEAVSEEKPPEEPEAPAVAAAPLEPPASSEGRYSVQVGALILDSSVRNLEKRLSGMGYDPLLKEGSTNAMMHFLTVGPFTQTGQAQEAMGRLGNAGIEGNLTRLSGGRASIQAGSYLLEKNARTVMDRIRQMGYPVRLSKEETRMPMTFVRVGSFETKDEAMDMRTELKGKGFDAIIVKLQ